jgi:hypothetical protein
MLIFEIFSIWILESHTLYSPNIFNEAMMTVKEKLEWQLWLKYGVH